MHINHTPSFSETAIKIRMLHFAYHISIA